MNNISFGIAMSLIAYYFVDVLQKKTKQAWLNPLLFSGLLIILILSIFNISIDDYMLGGDLIKALIAPATISLAIPLYKNKQLILDNAKLLFTAVCCGIVSNLILVLAAKHLLSLKNEVFLSIVPKSITTAIAIDVATYLGGITEITIATVLITGIFGAMLSPLFNKILNVKSDKIIGLALGTSAHAVGTAKAVGTNEVQGAFASTSLILSGLLTVLLNPLFVQLFKLL